MKVLVTGAAGFIGSNLMARLSDRGDEVVGLDNINDYYDVRLKHGRLRENGFGDSVVDGEMAVSSRWPGCRFIKADICDKETLDRLFAEEKFEVVVNLAAQAGVRYSITNPYAYLHSNLEGFLNVLEACRNHPVRHLVFASSSSVYGLNAKVPFSEADKADSQVSLYGATKKSNELMAHSYSKLYGIPATGLRYFTVYGPWGRPDMSPMLFATAISSGKPIKVFNGGDMIRDFTYVDDIVEGTIRVIDNPPLCGGDQPVCGGDQPVCCDNQPVCGGDKSSASLRFAPYPGKCSSDDLSTAASPTATSPGNRPGDDLSTAGDIEKTACHSERSEESPVPFEVYNIGCSNPVKLMDFISEIETALGKEAVKEFLPMQAGDVYQTYADCSKLESRLGYRPSTTLHDGIASFVNWFKSDKNPLR